MSSSSSRLLGTGRSVLMSRLAEAVVVVGRGLSSRKSSRPSLPGLALVESCDVDDEASAVVDDDVDESGRDFFEVSVGFFFFSWTC